MPTSSPTVARPADPVSGSYRPLALGDVSFDGGGYWGQWQGLNAERIIAHCREWVERVGWLGNLRAAGDGTLPGARRGRLFTDADVYKLLEAMSWEFGRAGDETWDEQAAALLAVIRAAMDDDGYVNSFFGRPGQPPRYSDLEWGHELYNYGHLLQAVIARVRTTGDREALAIGIAVADHICRTFGVGGIESVCGHPGVETALVEFARLTGDDRYREQAALFLDRRGQGTLADVEYGRQYFQDDIPIRDADVFRGHAVRALYLAAGAVDLAVDRDDTELLASIERQWEATVARRTYLTGGMGSHHQDEAFGEDFELPNDRAYCETCAGVASAMLSWRLLLATGRPRYADDLERVLHNVVATSPGRDGRSFFYANTLHQRTPGSPVERDVQSPRASASQRSAWFDVSCCPTNVARLFSTLACYAATSNGSGVQQHLYAAGDYAAEIDAGRVAWTVSTQYPHDGVVEFTITEAPPTEWRLSLRVPEWATSATLTTPTGTVPVAPGMVRIDETLAAGEVVRLDLAIEPRFTFPDERIDGARGAVAIERGPLVYCLESIDLPGGLELDAIELDSAVPPFMTGDADVAVSLIERRGTNASWPYGAGGKRPPGESHTVRLEPYSEWGERAPGAMRVWIPMAATART
jgi:DUF1680 family protein